MPKCGVCGWSFSDRTLTKHAETPCGEESEKAGKYNGGTIQASVGCASYRGGKLVASFISRGGSK